MSDREMKERREVRAALQHRRTQMLARYEDLAGRRHQLVALRTASGVVVCDRTMRAREEPIGCVAVLGVKEIGSVGAIVAEYLRWAPLGEGMGIREVSRADVAGDSDEGRLIETAPPPPWERLCAEMAASCREALDRRPRSRNLAEELAA